MSADDRKPWEIPIQYNEPDAPGVPPGEPVPAPSVPTREWEPGRGRRRRDDEPAEFDVEDDDFYREDTMPPLVADAVTDDVDLDDHED